MLRVELGFKYAFSTRSVMETHYIGVPTEMTYEKYFDVGAQIVCSFPYTKYLANFAVEPSVGEDFIPVFQLVADDETVVGRGVLVNKTRSPNLVTFTGIDYVQLLRYSLTDVTEEYTNATVSSIVSDQIKKASRTMRVLNTLNASAVVTTTETASYYSAFQPRLDLIRDVIAVANDQRTDTKRYFLYDDIANNRLRMSLEPSSTNYVSLFLTRDASLRSFSISDYEQYANEVRALGVKRDGSSVIYSTQSPVGFLERRSVSRIYTDITNQNTLDALARSEAKRLSTKYTLVDLFPSSLTTDVIVRPSQLFLSHVFVMPEDNAFTNFSSFYADTVVPIEMRVVGLQITSKQHDQRYSLLCVPTTI